MAVEDRPKSEAGENTSQINSAMEGVNGSTIKKEEIVEESRPQRPDDIFKIVEDSLEQQSDSSSSCSDEVDEV